MTDPLDAIRQEFHIREHGDSNVNVTINELLTELAALRLRVETAEQERDKYRNGFETAQEQIDVLLQARDEARTKQAEAEALAREVREELQHCTKDCKRLLDEAHALDAKLTEERTRREQAEQALGDEQVKLAACGVAALGNTPEAVKLRLKPNQFPWSSSYRDVCDAVDREMALQRDLDTLRQQVSLWRRDPRPRAEWEAVEASGACVECGQVSRCLPSCRKRYFDWAYSIGYHDGANKLERHDHAYIAEQMDGGRYASE